MRATLALFVLVSFISPAPFAECVISLDDEAIPELARSGRTSRRNLSRERFPSRTHATAVPRRAVLREFPTLRTRLPGTWIPRLFSRPPPF